MRKVKLSRQTLLLFLLLLLIVLMGIGYSAINSVTGEIDGKVIADIQSGVFIASVEYSNDVNADLDASTIKYYKGTYLQNTVKLSDTDANSSITYKVTIYNNSDDFTTFSGVEYDEEFYDNSDIIFETSGLEKGETINKKESKDIYITFKYKDGVIPENKILNANLRFKFDWITRMMVANRNDSSATYLRGTITKDKIETINFARGSTISDETISSFDASEKENQTIIGYYTDMDGNGLYELTFMSEGIIAANVDASYLFGDMTNLKQILFDNFSTKGVTNMFKMFGACSELTSLDLTSFNTNQVISMANMFDSCYKLISIYVKPYNEENNVGWVTSAVTESNQMFNASTNLIGGNGTEFDENNIDVNYARIDTVETPGYLTDIADKPVIMMKGNNASVTSNYLRGTIAKNRIRTISFTRGTTPPEEIIESFDASEKEDKSIMGYYTDAGNSRYNLIFMSESVIAPNVDASYLFCNLNVMNQITFDNFNTNQVIDMSHMFEKCENLKNFDVSKFKTNQLTNMSYMFYYCRGITDLDLSNFNTSQVTNMSYMLYACDGLINFDVSKFNTSNVTDMSHMFELCNKLNNIDVSNFDTSKVTDMNFMFEACKAFTSLDVSNFDTSQVTDMGAMFAWCTNLTNLDLNNFDTSQVTNMRSMFEHCDALTDLNISKFDTSKVTDMSYMFDFCDSLTSLDLSNFDTSQVNGMKVMFRCNSLTNLNISSFDTSNVTDMNSMFNDCSSLTSIDVSNFNTSNVIDMTSMFWGCSSLTSIDVSNFNTSNVTKMIQMFQDCTSLTSIDLSNFDTSKVTGMNNMFNGCSKITSINISSFDTSQVTNMWGMFSYCNNLTSIDISSFNTSRVTEMGWMFSKSAKLSQIYVSEFSTLKVTSSDHMFYDCTSLVGGNGTKYNSRYQDKTYARIDKLGEPGYFTELTKVSRMMAGNNTATNYLRGTIAKNKIKTIKFIRGTTQPEGTVSSFDASANHDGSIMGYYTDAGDGLYELTFISDSIIKANANASYLFHNLTELEKISFANFRTSDVTIMTSMFQGCSKLKNLSLGNFDTSNVTRMTLMFYKCNNLVSLDVSSFNTSKVVDMYAMFNQCSNLTSVDVSKFDTSQVTSMGFMFGGCFKLESLNLSSFDTSKVTSMTVMFNQCSSLTSLDLKGFDTSKVTTMSYMFAYCTKLSTIYVDDFSTSAVTDDANMFNACTSLVGGNGTRYNASYKTKTYARIDKAGEPGYFTQKYNETVMMKTSGSDNNSNYLRGGIKKVNIEKIKFVKGMTQPTGIISSFDASENQDGSIIGYYTDINGNGLYELTFMSNSTIKANADSSYLFMYLTNLKEITFDNFKTTGTTNMLYMFFYCSNLASIDLSNFDTSEVTNMQYLFGCCSSLEGLDISSFDTSKVTDMGTMFLNCSKLSKIYVDQFATSAVTNSGGMFYGCTNLVGGNGTTYDASKNDATYARIDKAGEPGYFTQKYNETVMMKTSGSDNNSNYLRGGIKKVNIEKIKFVKGMTQPTGIISSFDASENQDGSIIGYYTDINGNGLYELTFMSNSTIKANADSSYLFMYLTNLKEITFDNFKTTGTTNMLYMFLCCSNLTSLDLSNFDTNQVTNMQTMFAGCSKLSTIYVGEFSTSRVTDSGSMFGGCTSLVGGNGTTFNSSYTDATYARIDKSGTPGYFTQK